MIKDHKELIEDIKSTNAAVKEIMEESGIEECKGKDHCPYYKSSADMAEILGYAIIFVMGIGIGFLIMSFCYWTGGAA